MTVARIDSEMDLFVAQGVSIETSPFRFSDEEKENDLHFVAMDDDDDDDDDDDEDDEFEEEKDEEDEDLDDDDLDDDEDDDL